MDSKQLRRRRERGQFHNSGFKMERRRRNSSFLLQIFLALVIRTNAEPLPPLLPTTAPPPATGRARSSVSDQVQYYLYTRRNPTDKQVIYPGGPKGNYDEAKPTKILIHGYGDTGTTSWITHMTSKLLQKGDFNVISVDWSVLANQDYLSAVDDTEDVGHEIGAFISGILVASGASLDEVHVIGFSLGAHVAGYAGQWLGGGLYRITGLDPAGVPFAGYSDAHKLSKDDAWYVDVIHTAGRWIGMYATVGHVDFYPNSGEAPQPGCWGEGFDLHCSHSRAPAYFSESINSNNFVAYECSTWIQYKFCPQLSLCFSNAQNMMGYHSDPWTTGYFYLRTNDEEPYAQGRQSRMLEAKNAKKEEEDRRKFEAKGGGKQGSDLKGALKIFHWILEKTDC